MSAMDAFHDAVRIALERDGWTITHDPLSLEFGLGSLYVDLGAERVIAAERSNEKIAVEVKSFLSGSAVSEFHTALGQYLNYRLLMQEQYTEYKLYLAIPLSAYDSFFQHNGTEFDISIRLSEMGIAKQNIVNGFHSSYMRQFTEFAVG
jgi:XisH protein/XisI protein